MNIYQIPLGPANCYLIENEKGEMILIDCGIPYKDKIFVKKMKELSLELNKIKLIIITHGHWDHIGSAAAIKKLTGAKIAMHLLDKNYLEKVEVPPIPIGINWWGRFTAQTLVRGVAALIPKIIQPTEVDIVLNDQLSLEDYGIPGKIIHTPGHSFGSVSVILDSGEAFIGDMAVKGPPLRFNLGLPIWVDDLDKLKESWIKLLKMEHVEIFYPSHGEKFNIKNIKKVLGFFL